jgi:hypothetical protein
MTEMIIYSVLYIDKSENSRNIKKQEEKEE